MCLKQFMQQDSNQYNNTGLKFMAKFTTSFQAEDMHPLFDSMFEWIFHVNILFMSDSFHRFHFTYTFWELHSCYQSNLCKDTSNRWNEPFDENVKDIFIPQTVSLNASIRFRLCEFINLMLDSLPDDGDIEEFHCNEIISYMFDRLRVSNFYRFVQRIWISSDGSCC